MPNKHRKQDDGKNTPGWGSTLALLLKIGAGVIYLLINQR